MQLPKIFDESWSPYRGHAENIMRWCEDWVSQCQFDELCFNAPLLPIGINGDTPILMGFNQRNGEEMNCLRMLQAAGFILAERRDDGLVWYKRSEAL